MTNMPIKDALERYISEDNALFCMPGHKQGRGFEENEQKMSLQDFLLKCDLTEVEGLDNLHSPEGAIKEAQDKLSKLYKSKKSYFLVNGSTSGNLAMIFSAFKEGDKVLVERNCHRSIFNGIILRKLSPIYIKNIIDKEFNAPLGIDMEHFLSLLESHKDIKGVILTYPNYYGVCCNLKKIVDVCKEKGIKVLVDSAHGAHFGVNEYLPENPMKLGVDMAVMSAHKTLPSLTQTAYLHIAKEEDIYNTDFYVSTFLSTSPSYMFLLSMDYARAYLEEKGQESYSNLLYLSDKYRKLISELNYFKVLGLEDIDKYEGIDIDLTRLVINIDRNINTAAVVDYLRKHKVQVEMNDASNLVIIPSPFNREEEFIRLYEALKSFDISSSQYKQVEMLSYNDIPSQYILPWQALNKDIMYIDIDNSEGKISASNICPYPPGIPLVMIGEIIDKQCVDMIKYYLKNDILVMGVKDNRIPIIDI